MNSQISSNEIGHIPTTEELAQIKTAIEDMTNLLAKSGFTVEELAQMKGEGVIQEICTEYILKTKRFSFLRS